MKDFLRYQRQMLLPEFGQEKQQRLSAAKVLVIGAGGLGCPILLYLAAAGVGTIGIVDGDVVELSNLHRQVLFSESDIGESKALAAATKLQALNKEVHFRTFNEYINPKNAAAIIGSFDLVADGSDNFPTRYLVNDACVLLDKPLVYGSIYRFEGQVAVFNIPDTKGAKTNYRDLFPESPDAAQIPNCAEAGVLGVLPGIIGGFQANEALKILTGLGMPLINQLMTYNSLNNATYIMDLFPNPQASELIPGSLEELSLTDYEISCGFLQVENVMAGELETFVTTQKNIQLLDVREPHEFPKLTAFPYLSIPLGQLKQRLGELDSSKKLLVFCQSGKRSIQAAEIISSGGLDCKIYNLQGGMNEWISIKSRIK